MSASRKFLLVGLTGGIATGKSTVSALLRQFGSEVIDADLLAREVVEPGQPALAQIVTITHPAIRERFAARLAELDAQGFAGIVVFDAPVMIESGNYKNMERMIVVVTDDVTQMTRLNGRDGTGDAENRRKIASQMPLAEKAKLADYVIDNSGSREATAEQVRRVFAALMSELASRSAV
jgi:dephospho-CoA kinase